MSEWIFQFRNTEKVKDLCSITDLFIYKGNRFILNISIKITSSITSILPFLKNIFCFLCLKWTKICLMQIFCFFLFSSYVFTLHRWWKNLWFFFLTCQIHVYISLNLTEASWSIRFFIASNYLHYPENLLWWYYLGWIVCIHFSVLSNSRNSL